MKIMKLFNVQNLITINILLKGAVVLNTKVSTIIEDSMNMERYDPLTGQWIELNNNNFNCKNMEDKVLVMDKGTGCTILPFTSL